MWQSNRAAIQDKQAHRIGAPSAKQRVSRPVHDGLRQLDHLVAPLGGLVSHSHALPLPNTAPRFPVFSASLGWLSPVIANVPEAAERHFGHVDGSGSGLTPERARRLAVAESLERYSSSVFLNEQLHLATAAELGNEALDLDTLPRCSPTELAHPKCPVTAPDRHAPQRWVRGWSLTEGRAVWIPAVMTWLFFRAQYEGERFTHPISTGCAAHTDLSAALVSGLCEVIERDAISLVWLQRLRLPELDISGLRGENRKHLERSQRAGRALRFFDATTDLGVPTVYAVETFDVQDGIAQMVSCATDLDPSRAVAKLCRESVSCVTALRMAPPPPESFDDMVDLTHGAVYMGQRERRADFDFLLNSSVARRSLSQLPRLKRPRPADELARLLNLFRARGMQVYAVDLTTDEARRVGFHVVRVIVPALMPLSFTHRARYLAHPRLYDAPVRMGHPAAPEEQINPLPQPFA